MEVIICQCGTNLGAVIPIYTFLSEKIKRDLKNTKFTDVKNQNLDQTSFSVIQTESLGKDNQQIGMKDLLDMLHITRMCCRAGMLSKSKVSVS